MTSKMSLRSSAANASANSKKSDLPQDGEPNWPSHYYLHSRPFVCTFLTVFTGMEKQKTLLAEDNGHFSMIRCASTLANGTAFVAACYCSLADILDEIRALHLADLITEMNGMFLLWFPCPHPRRAISLCQNPT